MKRYLFLLIPFYLFTGCDDYEDNLSRDDKQILDLAYNQNYQYPESFYLDSVREGSVYYENTVSIRSESERDHIWIELSTNDRNEALTWSTLSNNYSSVKRPTISERETEKYFEFQRQNLMVSRDILFSRVHKTSYFEPKINKFTDSDTVGIYNGQLNKGAVKELVEYLWSCHSLDITYSKVIESRVEEHDTYFKQYIRSLTIVYGDFNISDQIFVYDNNIRLSKTNRVLTKSTVEVKVITGKQN